MDGRRLVILPSLPVAVAGNRFILTQKFVSGIREYQRLWPGPVHAVMEPASGPTDNLDNIALQQDTLPFQLTVMPHDAPEMEDVLRDAALALLFVNDRQTHLADACVKLGVPCIYGSEYSLQTRLQIASTSTSNPLRLARRMVWELGQELRNRRAIARASGVQCNGTPTYEAYRSINPEAMLFFDSRISAGMLAHESVLRSRFQARRTAGKLRLAFSGRLIPMKGADHLVRVAEALRDLGQPFELSICGTGSLEQALRHHVRKRKLDDVVHFKGNLDFERELVPFIRDHVDLFVCCHRQGDPSCTYLETMACGVPIVGYANEAFRGIVSVSGAGWSTPMNKPEELAKRISLLSHDEIESHSRKSLSFAREHTFEKEFERRIEHAKGLAGLPSDDAGLMNLVPLRAQI